MKRKYAWKAATIWKNKVPAAVAAKALEDIASDNDGRIVPSAIVEAAQDENHPLHIIFDWDNDVAAERWRLEQAQSLMRSLVIVVTMSDGSKEELPIRAYVYMQDEAEGGAYESLYSVMSDTQKREQLLERALMELEQWRHRYNDFNELAAVYKALETTKSKRGKRTTSP